MEKVLLTVFCKSPLLAWAAWQVHYSSTDWNSQKNLFHNPTPQTITQNFWANISNVSRKVAVACFIYIVTIHYMSIVNHLGHMTIVSNVTTKV